MDKVRILCIAPYEGMLTMAAQQAAALPEVSFTGFVGDLQPGADIAKGFGPEDFDVVLSRGGTAELIREQTLFPVIDIEPSVSDILRTISLAQSSNNRYAIVGFPAVTKNAEVLCTILRYQIDICTIHNVDEAREAVKALAAAHFPMVLCDRVTSAICQEIGIPALLISSGSESVREALLSAIRFHHSERYLTGRLALSQALLVISRDALAAFDERGDCVYKHIPEDMPPGLEERMREAARRANPQGQRVAMSVEGRQFIARCVTLETIEGKFRAVTVSAHSARPSLEKFGIVYRNRDEALDLYFNSFYGVTQPSFDRLYQHYTMNSTPLMIIGEFGTGKEQLARILYCHGRYQDAPMCSINCSLLKGKGWEHLTGGVNSPILETGITLQLEHIEALSEAQFNELFLTLRNNHFARNNQLIFTLSTSVGQDNPQKQTREQLLMSWFDCAVLHLPPLRDHKQDIPYLASLYIGQLNTVNATECMGFEPPALELLAQYDWPGNYDQFKRILRELVLLKTTPYIARDSVQSLLDNERLLFPEYHAPEADVFKGRTLAEIETLAVERALRETGGNQAAAARLLGIGRSSLWRMMTRRKGNA